MRPVEGLVSNEHQLRDLARQIETLAKEHPAYSQAQPIVQNCVDHLCAIARCNECNTQNEILRGCVQRQADRLMQLEPKPPSAFDTLPDDYEMG